MGEIADALNRADKRKHSDGRSPARTPHPHANSTNVCLATPTSEIDCVSPSVHSNDATPADAAAPALAVSTEASSQHITISMDRRPGWETRICAVDAESPTAVRFRHLAIKIRTLIETKASRSVLVTSALSNEGQDDSLDESGARIVHRLPRTHGLPSLISICVRAASREPSTTHRARESKASCAGSGGVSSRFA